jgi:hypothetical protein
MSVKEILSEWEDYCELLCLYVCVFIICYGILMIAQYLIFCM